MTDKNKPLEPALSACDRLERELKKRIGKPGGTLNRLVLSELQTIRATLVNMVPLGDMIRVLNSQTEVAVSSFRALDRLALSQAAKLPDNGNDDVNAKDNDDDDDKDEAADVAAAEAKDN